MAGTLAALPARARDEPRIRFRVEPAYTFCVTIPACSQSSALSLDLFIHVVRNPRTTVRLQVASDYQGSHGGDDDAPDTIDVTRGRWIGTEGVIDLRVRRYDASAALAVSWHAGYEYEPAATTPYHVTYLSYGRYFGRSIARGTDGQAHQFDIQVKVLENVYQSPTDPPQRFLALTPGVVLPLTPSGGWRVRFAYTAQRRVAGERMFSPYSGRLFASITDDVGDAIKAYLQFADTNRAGASATSLTIGAQYNF